MPVVRVGPLPAAALEAAAEFHARVLPDIVLVGEDLVLVFPSAPDDVRDDLGFGRIRHRWLQHADERSGASAQPHNLADHSGIGA